MDFLSTLSAQNVRPNQAPTLWQRLKPKRRYRHTAHYERVLGTSLELQIVSRSEQAGPQAEAASLAEIDRLETIFNAYAPSSELNRWQSFRDEEITVSPELGELLATSNYWCKKTQGAFNPAVEAITRIWKEHAEQNQPVRDELVDVLGELKQPLWSFGRSHSTACRLTRLPITLNSIAKGFIIDQAALCAAQVESVDEVLVNIGGDLRHIGSKPVSITIVDPFAPAENAPAAATIQICNQGLATSGNYRRGFRIGEHWFSHVIDPRTGYPVEHVVSASVIAPDAMTADVLATVFDVFVPDESLAFADALPNIGVLLITEDGMSLSNAYWKTHAVEARA